MFQLMTPERLAIVSLDFPELRERLHSGELTCVEVSGDDESNSNANLNDEIDLRRG